MPQLYLREYVIACKKLELSIFTMRLKVWRNCLEYLVQQAVGKVNQQC